MKLHGKLHRAYFLAIAETAIKLAACGDLGGVVK